MPKQRRLSGKTIISIFSSFGFQIADQKGSHVKLRRVISGMAQMLTIPNHKELDKGTVKAIYNQAQRYIAEQELRKFFYTD